MEFNRFILPFLFSVIILVLNPQVEFILIVLLSLFTYVSIVYSNKVRDLRNEKLYSVTSLEQKLKKSSKMGIFYEERFLSLAERMHNGLILINDEGIIEYLNPIFKISFGSNVVTNQHFTTGLSATLLKQTISDCYLLEKEVINEIAFNDQHYLVVSTPLFENQIFKGAMIITNDVTDIKRKTELERKFFADASHELKTPVSAIKSASEILLRDDHLPEDLRKEFTEIIHTENERLHNIIIDLLDISKLEKKGKNIKKEPYELFPIVEEAISTLKHLANNKNIVLKNLVDEREEITVDFDKFRRMLLNLIKNAIAYTDKGEIAVNAIPHEGYIEVVVKDTGIGIPSDEISNIFERFYRLDHGRSRDTGGTGLGLSIVKQIVEVHKGYVEVDSVPGRGTTFHLFFPK